MTTKRCPKCQEEIQHEAKKCKHCQADLRNWFLKHKILTGILVVLIITIIASMANDDSNNSVSSINETPIQEEPKETIKLTATTLYAEYEANEIQADGKYKDKLLEVSGIIQDIAKDILDNPYISLKTDNIIGSVQCMLADSEQSKASQLQKGASIVLEGKNSGKLGNIILRNCIIK